MSLSTEEISVLHVDDEPNFADMVGTFLERENDRITVETARSAKEGLEMVIERDVDCIISDYDMPGRNGIEFLEVVREDYPDLPFILYTGKGSEDVASEAISSGVTDYLRKESGTEQYELLANRVASAVKEYSTRKFEQVAKQDPLTLLEQFSDGFLALDTDWRFTYVNDEAREIFGAQPGELLGENIWELFPEAKGTPFYEQYHEALEQGENRTFEEYFEPWDRWYREHIYPSEAGISVITIDITEQKQRERRYDAILNHTDQFIALLDPDGTLVEANETAFEFGGLDREEVLGKKVWNAFWFQQSEETRENARGVVSRAADGKFVRRELQVQGGDRDAILDFSISPVPGEQEAVTLLVLAGRM